MPDPVSPSGPTYPVRIDAVYPAQSSRLLAACGILFLFPKVLLLFPHLIVLWFLGLASMVVTWVGFWIVLVTGSLPRSIFDFVLGCTRWQTRVNAWLFGLTDEYPPFSLD
jgi:hypothetical protein